MLAVPDYILRDLREALSPLRTCKGGALGKLVRAVKAVDACRRVEGLRRPVPRAEAFAHVVGVGALAFGAGIVAGGVLTALALT